MRERVSVCVRVHACVCVEGIGGREEGGREREGRRERREGGKEGRRREGRYDGAYFHSEGFPINPGGSLQRTYELSPLLQDNRVSLVRGDHIYTCMCENSSFSRTSEDWLWTDKSSMKTHAWHPQPCERHSTT